MLCVLYVSPYPHHLGGIVFVKSPSEDCAANEFYRTVAFGYNTVLSALRYKYGMDKSSATVRTIATFRQSKIRSTVHVYMYNVHCSSLVVCMCVCVCPSYPYSPFIMMKRRPVGPHTVPRIVCAILHVRRVLACYTLYATRYACATVLGSAA